MSGALPAALRELAAGAPNPRWATRALERLAEDPGTLQGFAPEVLAGAAQVSGSSQVAGNWLVREPALLEVFGASDLRAELGAEDYATRLGRPPGVLEPLDAFQRFLRRFRQREILRIIARESLGLAGVEETARELSALAEAVVESAMAWAGTRLTRLHGVLRDEHGHPNSGCALGMGKLGGGELNLSSDVDLIFLYRSARGRSSGGEAGGLEPGPYFAEVVRLVVEALGRVTEEGLVFRVDLDLRPEGRSGAPAQPLDNAVLYYQSWGQTWERAALMKARAVGGDRALGRRFLEEVEPFVFRRSLDYTTVEDIAEMKRRIDQHAGRRAGGTDDLKLGRGGIREVEFFVQTLQLIHGGKLPEVRERNTLGALGKLARAGVADAGLAQGLGRCYRFLRSVEHAVQALHLRQTHRLPAAPEELHTVARRLGFAGSAPVASLRAALKDVQEEVHHSYAALVHGAGRSWDEEPGAAEARSLLALEPGDPATVARLERAGFRDPGRALEALRLLQRGPERGHPSPRARQILGRLAPLLFDAARRAPDPDRALLGLAEFLAGSGARVGYLSLLEENPPTARLLVALFGTSGFLSRYLLGHPELLDELVLHGHGVSRKGPETLATELGAAMRRCRDEEERLEALRHFRNAEFLRIALNDLWGALGPDDVAEQITTVAEVCLEQAYREALARLTEKFGPPLEASGAPARFAVLGLGKLGGKELDYHSDLDILFLYSGSGRTRAPGDGRALDNAEFFARLAQRVIGILTVRTREGVAFRMDARLRPSGQAGPLVTSLAGFEAYHRGGGGQTWERQALIRLRPVAGDRRLGEEARAAVDRLLYAGPPERDPRAEVDDMRARMEREVGREEGARVDLKVGSGGTVDAEFAVQCLQLFHGWRDPSLRSPTTLKALEAFTKCGILAEDDGETLAQGLRFLRRVEGRLRILLERPTDRLPDDPERLAELAKGVGYGEGGAGALREEVQRHKAAVRRAYAHIVRGGEP